MLALIRNNLRPISLIAVLSIIFLLTYSPRFYGTKPWLLQEHYRLPIHFDEWFHLRSAVSFTWENISHLSAGFHWLLAGVNELFDLLTVYHLLPALWATLSALTLFSLIYYKTDRHFYLALLSVVFFASIKSNINLLGLWFFTPLTFSIPLIFLYLYLFTEGIRQIRLSWVIGACLIMAGLLPIHAISTTFSLPILTLYGLWFWPQTKQLIPALTIAGLTLAMIGIGFFWLAMNPPSFELISEVSQALVFPYGWGMGELRNSPLEVYSLIGYLLALIGWLTLVTRADWRNRYLLLWLWPIAVLIPIVLYRFIDLLPHIDPVSLLSPYQRNVYYFVLSLPVLSALGLYQVIGWFELRIKTLNLHYPDRKWLIAGLIVMVLFFTFVNYYQQPRQPSLDPRDRKLISPDEYQALDFLAKREINGKIIAPNRILWTWHPIVGDHFLPLSPHDDQAKRTMVRTWFDQDCAKQHSLNEYHNIQYMISIEPLTCPWDPIFKNDKIFIYAP